MAPHAEDNILVVLLLLLFSSVIAPLVFFVLTPVLFSLTLIWFSRIGSLLKTIVKPFSQQPPTGFLVSEVFFSFPSLLAAVLALNKTGVVIIEQFQVVKLEHYLVCIHFLSSVSSFQCAGIVVFSPTG